MITSLSGGVDSDSYPATEVESLPVAYGSAQHWLEKGSRIREQGDSMTAGPRLLQEFAELLDTSSESTRGMATVLLQAAHDPNSAL